MTNSRKQATGVILSVIVIGIIMAIKFIGINALVHFLNFWVKE